MTTNLYYNIEKYINSVLLSGEKMQLDAILAKHKVCKRYTLNKEVENYITYIDDEPFYVAPSFTDVVTKKQGSSLNPKFILFSAPGATGKSSLAKYVAHKYNAIYWNLSKVKIGTNSFVGSILKAVGASSYSNFISDLNSSKSMLVIDAFDEAEVVSGRKMISNFILDINDNLLEHTLPNVILLARTETAQYIASLCAENSISMAHYEIGFFSEISAKTFVERKISSDGMRITTADLECINSYYSSVKRNISQNEYASFLGYAPVLEAIAAHIKTSPNRMKMIQELNDKNDSTSIIMKIMDDLLDREQQEKLVPALKERCFDNFPDFASWDKLYSAEEQLVRLINYILFKDTSYEYYELDSIIPPQMVEDYQEVLNSFLPQHPFIRMLSEENPSFSGVDFTGPAFRDYTLAKIILNEDHYEYAKTYFEESQSQSYFPSQIFFDCYSNVSLGKVDSRHIMYVYDSFRSKATAMERPYLQCSEVSSSQREQKDYVAIFGMISPKEEKNRDDITMTLCVNNNEIVFEQMNNISLNTPELSIKLGRKFIDSRISNSSIICKYLILNAKNIVIESNEPEGCLIVVNEKIQGDNPTIDIVRSEQLRISAPNINQYYRFIPYKYDFDDSSTVDEVKFTHALRCIFVEFRTHGKDMLAKTADRIENVTVGNSQIKRAVLDYLKASEIIYASSHLYKINEEKMQEKAINFVALMRMNVDQLKNVYIDFNAWLLNR